MAITINQSPATFSPAYNDIVFVVTSTNKTQTNFKYIADIVIAGVSRRLKLSPNPTYGSAAFNVGRIVETYLSSDINKSTYGFQQNLNSYIPFTVQFGEEYGPSSGTTIYPTLTTSSTIYAFNSIFDFLLFKGYGSTDYVTAQGSSKPLLTAIPTNGKSTPSIRDSEYAWLHLMTATSGTIYYARVSTFNSAGTMIGDYKVENPYQAVTSINDRFIRFGCGTANLNLIASSGIINVIGTQPMITANVASYSIEFTDYVGNTTAEIKTFYVNNNCTKNDTYRFHFLNKLGGFDSFTFIRASTKIVNINRSMYKKNAGGLTSATAFGYSLLDRQDSQYDTNLKDNIRVKSDWIDEDTYTWLEELITSPEVYLDDATYGLVAVNVKNSSYQFKQTAQDKLFDLDIEFEYSFNRYRQRK